MRKFIESLLSDNSSISTVRFMSILSLLMGSIIAVYGIYTNKDLTGVAQVCAVFVGSAFAAKVGQKIVEK